MKITIELDDNLYQAAAKAVGVWDIEKLADMGLDLLIKNCSDQKRGKHLLLSSGPSKPHRKKDPEKSKPK